MTRDVAINVGKPKCTLCMHFYWLPEINLYKNMKNIDRSYIGVMIL